MNFCKDHKLEVFKLKNGNVLKVCFVCGLHVECDIKTGIPLHIFNELKPSTLKEILKE